MIQEFVQAIHDSVRSEIGAIHTAMPGKIVSFDPATGLASVQPVLKFKKPDGQTMDYPHITGVPVVFPQGMGQQATIAYPVKAGDGCLIIISEKTIDYWLYGQETSTDLAFDLTDAICIPGLFNKPSQIMQEACAQNAVVVDVKGTRLTLKAGQAIISATDVTIDGNVKVNGSLEATGDVIANSSVSLGSHTHSGDSGGFTSPPR